MLRGRRASIAPLAGGALIFVLVDALAFYMALYRPLLDPQSTTGAFEGTIARLRDVRTDPRRDVLVLGDSRIYSGLDPAIASGATGGRLRFLDGSVPGTTPRCWFFFMRAVDPSADRFRAIVVPVDTYADDDSAIGSLDGDRREMDLHYIVFRVEPVDIPKVASSFGDWRARLNIGTNLLLRGPELRDDAQALAANPIARFRAVELAHAADPFDPFAAHPRSESLSGLHFDRTRASLHIPGSVPGPERLEIETQVLSIVRPSASYGIYRRRWLGPIVARYIAAGVPVIFVRLPARPLSRTAAARASGSLLEFEHDGATLLSQRPYLAFERPVLFADHDHLNARGSRMFSALLGRDVARVLATALHAPARFGGRDTAPQNTRPENAAAVRAVANLLSIGVPLPFQSYEFWIFFAIVATLFYASPQRLRRWVLLGASYYFYARWNAWYVLFLWILTVSDYGIAIGLERVAPNLRRLTLASGIAANLAFLATFKYANFASSTVATLLGMHANPWLVRLIVPIGISFHTFQSISYLVDVYRGKYRAVRDPIDYALYLAFFPQLLAGPIVRAGLFFSELFAWRKPDATDAGYGCMRICFGLVKKIGIADQFAPLSDAYFGSVASHPGALAALGGILAFSMQIYFDFSGYSDIAIGCARLFGFVFPENFVQPYLATSITDFWHRWHITLSTWLRDYVYIPLGGSRHGVVRTLCNLMLTMLLGGLWHGAQWTFVAWGGVHGVMLCVERIFGTGRPGDAPRGVILLLRVGLTVAAVSLAWVLFRAPGFVAAAQVYRELVIGGWYGWTVSGWPQVLGIGIIVFGVAMLFAEKLRVTLVWTRLSWLAQAGTLAALLLALDLFSWPGASPPFIYFKF